MTNRESPLYWSFPCGTWFATQVRLSVYFPLLFFVFWFRMERVDLALAVTGILLVSTILHEFGHVIAARLTGGLGDEILIWPLGGLAFVQPAVTLSSRLLTTIAGPAMNLALCLLSLKSVIDVGQFASAINPLTLPSVMLAENWLSDVLVLVFAINWMLFLINLVPVYPLDGGRVVQTLLAQWWGSEKATETYLRVGFVVAILILFGGLLAESTWSVCIGAFILVLNMQESFQLSSGEAYDDSFMGYDFSQGYTSLEKADGTNEEPKAGLLQRWKARREAERMERERLQATEEEQLLDQLLEKVHQHGMDSLSPDEKSLLERTSARYRNRDHSE